MSSMTITDKAAAAYRARRAAELAAERRAMAESMDNGLAALHGFGAFLRANVVTLAAGAGLGLGVTLALMFWNLI